MLANWHQPVGWMGPSLLMCEVYSSDITVVPRLRCGSVVHVALGGVVVAGGLNTVSYDSINGAAFLCCWTSGLGTPEPPRRADSGPVHACPLSSGPGGLWAHYGGGPVEMLVRETVQTGPR